MPDFDGFYLYSNQSSKSKIVRTDAILRLHLQEDPPSISYMREELGGVSGDVTAWLFLSTRVRVSVL